MASRFNTSTLKVLRAGGWFEGRRLPVDEYAAIYERGGYPVPEPALRFLTDFGGLSLDFPDPMYDTMCDIKIAFDDPSDLKAAESAIGRPTLPWVMTEELLSVRLGVHLHQLGDSSTNFQLWMSEVGQIYGRWVDDDEAFSKLGDSIEEAFENIWGTRNWVKVEIPELMWQNIYGLSRPAREFLQQRSWSPALFDVAQYASVFGEAGYPVSDTVLRFLSRFGGLTFRYPMHMLTPDENLDNVDLSSWAEIYDPTKLEDWSRFVAVDRGVGWKEAAAFYSRKTNGRKLHPIGVYGRGYHDLWMSQYGRVYGSYELVLIEKLGESGQQAIDALLHGDPGETIWSIDDNQSEDN